MSAPDLLPELSETGPYTGAGPHTIPSSIAAPPGFRSSTPVRFVVRDTTGNRDLLYSMRGEVVIPSDGVAVVSDVVELYAAPGWSGNVTASVSIVGEEIKGSLTVPAGHTFEVTFRADGVST